MQVVLQHLGFKADHLLRNQLNSDFEDINGHSCVGAAPADLGQMETTQP